MSEMNGNRELFVAVMNGEEQYSIWPADKTLPDGWKATEMTGSREDCLAYIDRVWTDMRPLSLRVSMQEYERQ
ncbi:MbtH family protein [Rhizobium sp. NPDC090279]|uniref:MbtH family protein n=1 Tax=Rhizobium sp. NPDC090279 TaxID=3364499 RepID=UPI00383A45FF